MTSQEKPYALEQQIVELIQSNQLQDSVANLAEAGIDQLMQGGFLRDVPVLGTVLGTLRAAGAIRDLLLARKLGRFLVVLQEVPIDERSNFCSSLKDADERQRVGEALLLMLDRLDDMEKPDLLARCFGAFVQGFIDRTTFQQLSAAVDRLLMVHLQDLCRFYRSSKGDLQTSPLSLDVLQALSFTGLIRIEATGDGGGMVGPQFAGATIHYERNALGEKFVEIITKLPS